MTTSPDRVPRSRGDRPRLRRPDVGRAKVALPNGLTLGNLFFGINAIIWASRADFDRAVLFIVLGGVCDAFDGAAARATRTGGRFGEELDSLVDAISFGLAPAMIVHFSTLANGLAGWNWAVFIFAACAVMRLARFNVTQAGESKTYFQGLPSPAAGGTLATYYWFSQTSFYQDNAAIVGLPWHTVMQVLMVVLGFLMVSNVPYPAWPKVGLRTVKGMLGLAGVLFILFGIGYWRRAFFFPFGIGYVAWGLGRAALMGLWEFRPRRDDGTDGYGRARPARAGRASAPRGVAAIDSEDDLDALGLIDDDRDDLLDDDTDYFDDAEEPLRPAPPASPARLHRDRPERGERGERGERPADDRPDRRPRADAADRAERTSRPPRPPRPPRPASPARPARPEPLMKPAPTDAEGEDAAEATRDEPGRADGAPRKRRKRRKPRGASPDGARTQGAPAEASSGDGGASARQAPVTFAPAVPPAAPPPPQPYREEPNE